MYKDMMDTIGMVNAADPELGAAMERELTRQRENIELIASENIVSPAVMAAMGSVLTNKYAEGLPGKRYYGGCVYVDEVENIAIQRACQLFGAKYANVQPHSGAQANLAVYFALLELGDTVMGMDLSQGGHLTHGSPVNMSGKNYHFISYGVGADGVIDYAELEKQVRKVRPKMLVAGASAYPRAIDFEKLAEIAHGYGAYLMVDMAHIAGLVAGGQHQSPVPYADVVTTTTHKTLRGPRGGLILTNNPIIAKRINSAVFPGTQGGPLEHVIAGKAVCFGEALKPEFKEYAAKIVENAKAMADELHEMGIRLMVSIWPQIDWRSENYEEMKQQGLLVKSNAGVDVQMLFHGNNVFLDATNPRTRKYVWEKVKKNYADLGIRTFWLDEAEPEFSTYEYECYRYAAGPVEEIGNIYPREYSRMFYEGQKESGQEDIVNLVRCAWLGSQKYGALVWSGDIFSTYEDFRKQICAGLHMGLCGIPWWTTDIGGFHGGVTEDPDFQELLVRWFQFGTFCPVMRIHGNRGPREEIINKAGEVREGTGADNEVWSFGEKNYEILTKFIGVREKMRDYTRSLMAEAHEKGTPVMRTMFYEFPEDAACWDISDAYMFGSDILVAPIVRAKATSRTVYLPAGASWTLANTGDVYEGGKAYEIEAPIETLPIFLRDGKQGYLVGEI